MVEGHQKIPINIEKLSWISFKNCNFSLTFRNFLLLYNIESIFLRLKINSVNHEAKKRYELTPDNAFARNRTKNGYRLGEFVDDNE